MLQLILNIFLYFSKSHNLTFIIETYNITVILGVQGFFTPETKLTLKDVDKFN